MANRDMGFSSYAKKIYELDTEIIKLVRKRSTLYVKEGEAFLSGSVTEGGFIPRFMATNELELDEMSTMGHIRFSESQAFLESIEGHLAISNYARVTNYIDV